MLASLSERATKLHAASSCSENIDEADEGDGQNSHNFSIDDVTDEGEECEIDHTTTSAEVKNGFHVASSTNLENKDEIKEISSFI